MCGLPAIIRVYTVKTHLSMCRYRKNEIFRKGAQRMEQKPALTIRETAKEYNFPEYAIRTLVKRGAFPVIQVGSRCYITREVFAEYLKKGGARYEP